jgi:hypothetical protein
VKTPEELFLWEISKFKMGKRAGDFGTWPMVSENSLEKDWVSSIMKTINKMLKF